jgi:steroid 5-alpha reductase family enzyme
MTLIEIAGSGLFSLLLLATLSWLYSLFASTPVVLERWWGVGIAAVNALYFALAQQHHGRHWLLLVLVTLWGIRHTSLALKWPLRERTLLVPAAVKTRPLHVFRKHYLSQVLQMFLASAPLFVVQTSPEPRTFTAFDGVALAALAGGLYLAVKGGKKLARLRAKTAALEPEAVQRSVDALMKEPFHYGEVALWTGFYVLALAVASGFLTLFSPVIMSRHLRRFVRPRAA